MGSCGSNDRAHESKNELELKEEPATKVEASHMRRIMLMNRSERREFLSSSELTELLRTSGSESECFSRVLEQCVPYDNDSSAENTQICKSLIEKIARLKQRPPIVKNPNHSQFTAIAFNYSTKIESLLKESLSTSLNLVAAIHVLTKVLHVLASLSDAALKPQERWWGTGFDHSKLNGEMDILKIQLDAPIKQIATDYLSSLFGGISPSLIQQAAETAATTRTGELAQQVVEGYLQQLYTNVVKLIP